MGLTALVIPVRRGENEELRYALRAACDNLPHDELWLVGEGPEWVRPTGRLRPPETPRAKWQNLQLAWQTVASAPDIPDDIVWMDDDQFVMVPVYSAPIYHHGYEPTNRTKATHCAALSSTERLLQRRGVVDRAVNYEIHAPLPVSRARLAEALALLKTYHGPLHVRTLYGNAQHIGGTQTIDFKLGIQSTDFDRPVLSTTEDCFARAPIGAHIRASFPDPCRWEAP